MGAQEFNRQYWENRWKTGETQWDVGYPTPPLAEYSDQLNDKLLRILIPGAGNAYEGIYLLQRGFKNVSILDISNEPLERIRKEFPEFAGHLIQDDFFNLKGPYDLILEQTFFCSLDPSQRKAYAQKCHELLSAKGVVAGVLFETNFGFNFPPFGGTRKEYQDLFSNLFLTRIEPCYNSIKPRQGRELFIQLVKKQEGIQPFKP